MFMATALRKVAWEMPLLWLILSAVGLQQVPNPNSSSLDPWASSPLGPLTSAPPEETGTWIAQHHGPVLSGPGLVSHTFR